MRFGEKLLQAKVIDEAQLEAGLAHQQQTGQRLGEALYELGYIGEEQLLAALAREFGTRYVSAQKLSRARVEPELLQLVPLKFAEENLVVPIMRGKDGHTLGAVTCEPQNQQVAEELSIITGFASVRFFVSTRQALQALIRKLYRGDLHAFDNIEQAPSSAPGSRDLSVASSDIQQEDRGAHSGRVVAEVDSNGKDDRQRTSSWTRAVESVRESTLLSDNDFIETLASLVGLLEMQGENRHGHSARVARLTKAVSAAFDLDERQCNHHLIGAYLHDLGKRTNTHLTLLSIAANFEHRYLAQRYHLTPARLFDAVHLPREVNRILAHLYEAFDGSGLPEELSGDRIPLGARIIAAVDAFDDLVHNPNNLVGATLEPQQALARMRKEAGVLFDEQVIEALEVALQQTMMAGAGRTPTVLVAEPDASASSALELKLAAAGFEITTARDSEAVTNLLGSDPPDALVVDYALAPDDGLVLLDRARAISRLMPVFMTASNPQPQVVTEAFKHDVTDFLTRPFLPEVLVAKLQKELSASLPPATQSPPAEASPGQQIIVEVEGSETTTNHGADLPTPSSVTISGVGGSHGAVLSGSLEGKRALSLIRALAAKRRTGQLSLRLGKQKGEMHFNQGHIFQALVGENQGEEAFLELAAWRDCLYRFDPNQKPAKRVIKTATAKLLQIAKLMS